MIHRREYGTEVLPGINLSGNDRYADMILSTRWFGLSLRWVKPERRLIVRAHRKFLWPRFGPWRKVHALQAELDKAQRERDDFERELGRACDRYDKVRDMNTQLRDALTLYRNA